jgi:hypothetical protein
MKLRSLIPWIIAGGLIITSIILYGVLWTILYAIISVAVVVPLTSLLIWSQK